MMSAAVRHEASSRTSASLPAATRWRSIAISGTMPEPPPTSSSGPPVGRVPGEVAADRAAQLELVAAPELVDEVRRDLAVVQPLDREHQRLRPRAPTRSSSCAAPGSRPRRSGGRRRADPPGARSTRRAQHEALDPRRLLDRLDDARRAARSVARVPLLEPWIAVVVVAVALPEARLVLARADCRPRTHFALFQK